MQWSVNILNHKQIVFKGLVEWIVCHFAARLKLLCLQRNFCNSRCMLCWSRMIFALNNDEYRRYIFASQRMMNCTLFYYSRNWFIIVAIVVWIWMCGLRQAQTGLNDDLFWSVELRATVGSRKYQVQSLARNIITACSLFLDHKTWTPIWFSLRKRENQIYFWQQCENILRCTLFVNRV